MDFTQVRRSRLLPVLLALGAICGSAAAAPLTGSGGPGGGGLFGTDPTTGWLTALGLVSVGVVGVVRRRHRAIT
jgi:hypothetical protein